MHSFTPDLLPDFRLEDAKQSPSRFLPRPHLEYLGRAGSPPPYPGERLFLNPGRLVDRGFAVAELLLKRPATLFPSPLLYFNPLFVEFSATMKKLNVRRPFFLCSSFSLPEAPLIFFPLKNSDEVTLSPIP